MNRLRRLPSLIVSAAFFTGVAWAQTPDKSAYTLFNPTPREHMRELSTDRPDQTESPYTIDAGHWQIELDFANYTYDKQDGVRTETLNLAPVNVKLGVTNDTDVQFIFDSYSRERVRATGSTSTTRDWGDLTVRVKHNFWGNDGGDTAFAAMPFVKIPLNIGDAGNDLVEGGLILPLAVALPRGWSLGLMTEFDVLADGNGDGHHLEWINSIAISRDLTSRLGGYVEFFSAHSYDRATDWLAQVDVGFTYAVNDDTQLDAGCNFGVTRGAPDVQPFLGLTVRY
ncbi:MAG: transporter [Rariglobus sp.]